MKKQFTNLWKRNLAFFKLAIVSNLEYRLNFFVDAALQPAITSAIELLFWAAIFRTSKISTIQGFGVEYYLSYVLWATFFARIYTNWMYEVRMSNEINLGNINSILVRPVSFYEYYFSQFMGYKLVTAISSLIIPISVVFLFKLPTHWARIPAAIALLFYFLIFVFTLSFIIATMAFHFNKTFSFTFAKNVAIWIFSGELFPIDMVPEPYQSWMLKLPFAAGVYIPVGYITGRIHVDKLIQSFQVTTVGIIILSLVAIIFWKTSLKSYSGTGA